MATFYLDEDLAQIKKFFPRAESVTMRTPFDITERPAQRADDTVNCQPAEQAIRPWYGDLLTGSL